MKEDDHRMANNDYSRSTTPNNRSENGLEQERRGSVDSYGYEIRDPPLVLKKEKVKTTSRNNNFAGKDSTSSSDMDKTVRERTMKTSNTKTAANEDSDGSSKNRRSSDNQKLTTEKSQPKKVHTSGSGWSPSPSLSPVQPFSIDTLTSLWNK